MITSTVRVSFLLCRGELRNCTEPPTARYQVDVSIIIKQPGQFSDEVELTGLLEVLAFLHAWTQGQNLLHWTREE
jgi:hypothetical protein